MDSPSKLLPDSPLAPEKANVEAFLFAYGLEFTPDRNYVRWSPGNRKHPRNWSPARKAFNSSVVIFLDFFTTGTSTAGSAADEYASREFGIDPALSVFLFVSLYLIGQCLGGIVFPPYSEAFGRKKLYIISTALYSIFCVVVGIAPSVAAVAVGRFFSGFLSAIPTVIVAGSIEDMFDSKGRVWMIFLWAMAANFGLCMGPIASVFIAACLGWQWVFFVAAIVLAVVTIICFGLHESRPSFILGLEVAKARKESGVKTLKALNPDHTPDLQTFARIALFRPVRLFFTEPIVLMVSVMSAAAFALIYLFTEVLPLVYRSMGFTDTSSYLPLIAVVIGLVLGLLTRIYDHHKIKRHESQDIPLEPEQKLIGFSLGAPMLAGGLWLFAWTIPPLVPDIHWMVPSIALVMTGYAANEFDCVLAGYLADSYVSYAASGLAALALLRSLLSATFPLFAARMYERLGANVASSILAGVATVFCFVPPLFTRYGKQIRGRSDFAGYSLQIHRENGGDENSL